ncbi:MAG: hypothetical protein CSB24_02540 [Deltaproteobacteria bacterium]|nr:MAG: hypothetical protein CSB24_02540 [Deltaproteobacteria bacterium]
MAMPIWIDSWLALPAGLLIASAVSIVGIGGGILWMPFFIIVMKMPPDLAVLTSLLIQTAGMGSGSAAYIRKKQVDVQLVLFFLAVTIPGIAGGAWLAHMMQPEKLETVLGAIALTTAMLFVSASHGYNDLGNKRADLKTARRYGVITSILAVFSGLLSVSIGEWLVPMLRSRLSLKMGVAIGSSITIIFGNCVSGALFHYLLGSRPDLAVVLWAVPGVLIGGQIGPHIASRINDRMLKEVFIFFLTLVGIHLIYNSF